MSISVVSSKSNITQVLQEASPHAVLSDSPKQSPEPEAAKKPTPAITNFYALHLMLANNPEERRHNIEFDDQPDASSFASEWDYFNANYLESADSPLSTKSAGKSSPVAQDDLYVGTRQKSFCFGWSKNVTDIYAWPEK